MKKLKKLVLRKEVVANLSKNEMKEIIGGTLLDSCQAGTCGAACPTSNVPCRTSIANCNTPTPTPTPVPDSFTCPPKPPTGNSVCYCNA